MESEPTHRRSPSIRKSADITFDTVVSEKGQPHIEGCYREQGRDWKVFYFTSWLHGKRWEGITEVIADAVWQSGIGGVEVHCREGLVMNKAFVKKTLSEVLGVTEWLEVPGPDSLKLK